MRIRMSPIASMILACGLAVAFSSPALAQPVNDRCSTATIAFEGDTPYDTAGATLDPSAPPPTFGHMQDDVWFVHTATCATDMTIGTCEDDNSLEDTILEVYAGSCGALTSLAASDDDCGLEISDPNFYMPPVASRVAVSASPGETFYIRVSGAWGSTVSGELSITYASEASEECEHAPRVCEGVYSVSTVGATRDPWDPTPPCTGFGSGNVWYRHVAGHHGILRVSMCIAFNSAMLVVHDDADGSCDLTPIGCSTGSACGGPSITLPATAGEEFVIEVTGYALSGTGDLEIEQQDILECLSGPGQSLGVGCDLTDLDSDGDCDLADIALFQSSL